MSKVIHLWERLWCDAATAFSYFTVAERLQLWLCARAHVEPVVGGAFELFWETENHEAHTKGCRITAIAPPQLLCFEWRVPSHLCSPARDLEPPTHVAVAFIPDGTETVVHLVHSGWPSFPPWEAARTWQVRSWAGALTRLRTLINGC